MHPRRIAAIHSEHPAVIMADGSQTLTYGQLETRANQGAHYIRSLGIANGDSIAIWLPNGITFFEVFWAAQRAGLYICPISTQFRAEEAAYILSDSGSKLLVTDQTVRLSSLHRRLPQILTIGVFQFPEMTLGGRIGCEPCIAAHTRIQRINQINNVIAADTIGSER